MAGEATGKVLVFGVLFVAALSAYRAVPGGGFVARATAAAAYLLNPFVFGRLHYGQLFLLAGYAVLPWVALRLRILFLKPGRNEAAVAAVSLWLLGTLSLHLLLVAALLGGAMFATHIVANIDRRSYLGRLAVATTVTGGLALAASAYWIIPVWMGRGPEGSTLTAIGSGDLAAYAAVPDPRLGLLPNLLGLYGFWAEATGRFTSMKDFVPLWPAVLAFLLLIVGIGAMSVFRQRHDRLGPWIAGLLLAAGLGILLEMGVSAPVTSGLVKGLGAHVPLYLGMRDAGKWAALLALVYSQLIGLGAVSILEAVDRRVRRPTPRAWVRAVAAGVLLASAFYYGNGLLFGMHGEIRPSHYPTGWYAADQALKADPHPSRVLFLPWHEYMSLSFVRNQNSLVAPPAPAFFSMPTVVSRDPEVKGIKPPDTPDQVAVSSLVNAADQGQWAQVLAGRNIKYILVAREVDWRSYDYLDRQTGLVKVGDYGTIVLYRNTLMP